MKNIDVLKETFIDEELLIIDGFDNAIVGIDYIDKRIIYDIDLMIEILYIKDNLNNYDAIEHLEFNILNSYVGEKTPIFIYNIDNI